jgi:hypothetical protein
MASIRATIARGATEGTPFWIDEEWLSSSNAPYPESSGPLTEHLRRFEKQLIESALAESNGKVAGFKSPLPHHYLNRYWTVGFEAVTAMKSG